MDQLPAEPSAADGKKLAFVTIGVYGFTPEAFFAALRSASVDTFCDIRWRRGVRGSEYAFANSARLQARLSEMGIRYLHFHDLAPNPELRERQVMADKAEGTPKRKRTSLGKTFIDAYRAAKLAEFDSHQFAARLGKEAHVVALFCVEREPAACHRSLLAERLQRDLGTPVIHIVPSPGAAK